MIEMLERQLSAGEIADAEKAAKAWSPKEIRFAEGLAKP